MKDCFAAWESLATFISFDLLVKSYKKNSVVEGLKNWAVNNLIFLRGKMLTG